MGSSYLSIIVQISAFRKRKSQSQNNFVTYDKILCKPNTYHAGTPRFSSYFVVPGRPRPHI